MGCPHVAAATTWPRLQQAARNRFVAHLGHALRAVAGGPKRPGFGAAPQPALGLLLAARPTSTVTHSCLDPPLCAGLCRPSRDPCNHQSVAQ